MKQGQLAISISFGLVRIDKIVSATCIYCTILTGNKRGGGSIEYATTLTHIPNTENVITL